MIDTNNAKYLDRLKQEAIKRLDDRQPASFDDAVDLIGEVKPDLTNEQILLVLNQNPWLMTVPVSDPQHESVIVEIDSDYEDLTIHTVAWRVIDDVIDQALMEHVQQRYGSVEDGVNARLDAVAGAIEEQKHFYAMCSDPSCKRHGDDVFCVKCLRWVADEKAKCSEPSS